MNFHANVCENKTESYCLTKTANNFTETEVHVGWRDFMKLFYDWANAYDSLDDGQKSQFAEMANIVSNWYKDDN